ncbi:MAG: hypothetical protein M1489_06850 [Firmicutes bacterium]|nr:hypothetical protein [Bacillota bacterium]
MEVNEYKPGRVLYRCPGCGKEIWLTKEIIEKVYGGGNECCLDCRNGAMKSWK